MVYCTKCGTKNDEDAAVCVKCGAGLATSPAWRRERKRAEEECFGLPHGGVIVGAIIGIVIILVGLSQVPGLIPPGVRDVTDPLFWPAIIIVFGVLIVAGAIYKYGRRH